MMTAIGRGNRVFLLTMAVITLLVASCSKSRLPSEFKLDRVVYQAKDTHVTGPAGINQSFIVYELPQDVAATIAAKGLAYLNSLPSDGEKAPPTTGPWWGPFSQWSATPVPSEKAWLRYGRDLEKDWKPSITTFFASFKGDNTKDRFISMISREFSDSFHEAITTSGSFYAYGDYRDKCLVVVSPRMGKVFYLFRD